MARRRDYAAEYRRRQELARQQGYRSYGAKRYAQQREARRPSIPRPRVAIDRALLRQAAKDNIYQHFGTLARPETVEPRVDMMTTAELRMTARATAAQLRRLARQPPIEREEGEEPDNPWWYH